MTTRRPLVVRLAGQVWGVAAWDAGGPIVTTTYDGEDLGTTVACAVDLAGKVLWQRRFQGHPFRPRLSGDRTAWIAHRGARGVEMSQLDSAGKTLKTIGLESHPSEVLGEFVVLPDGLMVLWTPAVRGLHARLARHDSDGSTRWSVPLPLLDISLAGFVAMLRAGEVQPSPPQPPRGVVEAGRPTALLVSGSRAAATVCCDTSGIAVTFFVDTDTGQVAGTTAPSPICEKAIAGPGEFLIGFQGYGAFHTAHYDAAGTPTQVWPTHAHMLVDAQGVVSGVESENTNSAQYFVQFGADSTVEYGAELSGYYTAYPALDSQGTAVFWRDGFLLAVDAEGALSRVLSPEGLHVDNSAYDELIIAREPEPQTVYRVRGEGGLSRVLLLEEGHVAFAQSDELIIYWQPKLGTLNDGIWPCADGGLQGNPVKSFPPT
ncbi:hypothetical protein [Mycolicibacterium stellerae]|uniref:hypothetical protein n=1 Tax=Mycolicibacterium stellerae TaxID=2358193 RepID=UPI0013DE221E|nr:hypothetical protein [Mycolicibacterium stellerae]